MRPHPSHSFELLKRASLAATILVSAGATYLAHEHADPEVDVPYDFDIETVHDRTTTEEKPAGKPYVGSLELHTPGLPEVNTSVELRYPAGEYARNFADDPNAEVVDTPAAEEIGNIVSGLLDEGWTVRLEVFGKASAEDESIAPHGGTTTPSQKNIDLADERRDSFINHLEETQAIPEGVEIVPLRGREGNLTADQYLTLVGYTEHFGYQNVKEMIDGWNNDPESMPPIVDRTLQSWLGADRSVSVEIIAQREVPGSEAGTQTEELICVVPVKTVTTNYEHEEVKWDDVTIPMPIVVPIPIVRRRRKGKGASPADGQEQAHPTQSQPATFRQRELDRVKRDLAAAQTGSGGKKEQRRFAGLPWRKISAGGLAIALALGIGYGASRIDWDSGSGDSPEKGVLDTNDPFCPPELREVVRTVSTEVETVTVPADI